VNYKEEMIKKLLSSVPTFANSLDNYEARIQLVTWAGNVGSALRQAGMSDEYDEWDGARRSIQYANDTAALNSHLQSLQGVLLGILARSQSQELGQGANEIIANLRPYLSSIQDNNTVRFLEEAVACFEKGLYRASVVLSWVGAISVLYDYTIQNYLEEFNDEAARRNPRWKFATSKDDLAEMKEFYFLEILEALSIIGKNVKQELQDCLKLRNGCGHPNSLVIGSNKVAAHIEVLILNVFLRFS
jgi:hypothetical protein